MNKIFVHLLFVLGMNFSLYSADSILTYDQTNEDPTLEDRAAQIQTLLNNKQAGIVVIAHTKYVLDPQASDFNHKIQEIQHFLDRVTHYDGLMKTQQTPKLCSIREPNGINYDQAKRPKFMDQNYSKVWVE